MKGVAILGLFLFLPGGSWAQATGGMVPSGGDSDLSVACIQDQGKRFSTREGGGCDAVLPKCSELKAAIEKKVKAQLSMKIYGYWKKKDLDLLKTTLKSPVGPALPRGLCSVIGHHISYAGSNDLEFQEAHSIPSEISNGGVNAFTHEKCGEWPKFYKVGEAFKLGIEFNGAQGRRLESILLGAYPYEVRAAAFRFFSRVLKFEDLTKEWSSVPLGLKSAFHEAVKKQDEVFKNLPGSAKAECLNSSAAKVQSRCLALVPPHMPDPLCAWSKTQSILDLDVVSDFIVSQILSDAMASFDRHFSKLFHGDSKEFTVLMNACAEAGLSTPGVHSKRKRLARVISCVTDGDWFRVSESNDGYEADEKPKLNRKHHRSLGFRLDREELVAVDAGRADAEAPYTRKVGKEWLPVTLANGFEGLVEFIIRHRICGQNAVTDPSPACEEAAIPDQPEGVEW